MTTQTVMVMQTLIT